MYSLVFIHILEGYQKNSNTADVKQLLNSMTFLKFSVNKVTILEYAKKRVKQAGHDDYSLNSDF